MASALAQQLSQLKGLHVQERWTRGKHSLLFDYQKAADVSAETLLGIAQQGIETLCKVDRRYAPFIDSLFSRGSLSVLRDQLTKDDNEQLDNTLKAFFRVLVNHFLLPAAFQVLEYCVRRYQAHVYNVPELLLCALPYHSTPEFARLVALLQLKGTVWEWLTPCQQTGAPPPRDLLVRRCANDKAVVREICRGAESLGMQGFISKTYLSFYAVLLCEVFTAAPRITEDLLTVLLPFLAAGLKSTATKDYRAATLMVLTQLLCKAQLGRDFLSAMVPEVIRSAPDLGDSTTIMLLTHMAASQPELKTLPIKSLQLLEELCQTGQQVADLQARGANVNALLKLLMSSLAHTVPQHPQLQPLLLDLVHQVSLDSDLVQLTVSQLLQTGAKLFQQQDVAAAACHIPEHLQKALRAFDIRYPEQLDAAINALLQMATTTEAAVDSKKPSSKHKRTQLVDSSSMFKFVQQCFDGSSHEVIAADQQTGSDAQQQQALTLSLAVSAPASQMRIMALEKLDALCSSSAEIPASTRQLLHCSLLSGLQDDVFAVAGAAAAAAGVADIAPEQSLPALQLLLARAAHCLASSKDAAGANAAGSSKDVIKAAKAALAAVAAVGERCGTAVDVLQQCRQAQQQQAAAILLEYMLADKRLKKLSKAAAQTCTTCKWHPLLQLLLPAPGVTAAVQEEAVALNTESKKRRKGAPETTANPTEDYDKHANAVMLNKAVVQALADGLSAPDGALHLLEVKALAEVCGPRCLHLLQLALMKAASVAGDAAVIGAATPSGKVRGSRARQQRQGSAVGQSGSQGGAASSAQIAVALLHMLEQQTSPSATSSQAAACCRVAGVTSVLHIPQQWSDTAAAVLDDTALPNKQHYQQLHIQLPQLQAAILLAALKAALTVAPAAELSAVLGQPAQLFARLAMVAASNEKESLQQHLQLLVAKMAQNEQQLTFLADMYGLPAGLCSAETQVCALQLLRFQVSSSLPATSCIWFVQLLAAANSSNRVVRSAALDTLFALPITQLLSKSQADGIPELIGALQQQEQLLRGSGGALASLLCSAVSANNMDVVGTSRGRSKAKPRSSKAAKAASDEASVDQEAACEMHLSVSCIESLQQMLLLVLADLHQESQLEAAELAAAVLFAAGSADAVETAAAAQSLLQQLLHGLCSGSQRKALAAETASVCQQLLALQSGAAADDAAKQLQRLRTVVAVGLLQFYTPESLKGAAADRSATGYINLLQLPHDAESAAVAGAINTRLSDAQLAAVAPVRAAALSQLDAALFAVLTPEQQQSVLSAALQTHAADGDSECRAAAKSALEQLPVTAGMLLPLLQRVTERSGQGSQPQQQQLRAKRSKRATVDAAAAQQQDSVNADPVDVDTVAASSGMQIVSSADVDAANAALELLQWKDDVQDKEQLVQPLQQVLRSCIPLMGTIAETYQEDDVRSAAQDSSESSAASPSAVGYAAQLSLLTLENLVKQHTAAATDVDPALVLTCASAAPDGAVRNAALLLLAVLAQLSPEEVLEHVLQALTVIQQSAAFQEDSHSQAVASAALSSLVPAWLSAGRGSEELWSSLITALPKLPATRRLKLLESLLQALPIESGLSVGLLLMMQRVVSSTAPAAVPASGGNKIKRDKQETTGNAVAAVDDLAKNEADWLPDLMAALCEKVPVPVRLQAFSDVLQSSLKVPDGSLAAHEPLPRLAVTFVTTNLQAKSVLAAAHDTSAVEAIDVVATDALLIQRACQSIMSQALQHLLQLNPTAAAAQASATPNKGSKKLHKAVRAAAAGVYELLSALESVQDAASYLQAVVELSRHPAESVQRRALKLLAARLMKVQVDLADLEAATEGLPASQRQAKVQQLAQAGLAVCQDLPRLMQSQAPLTRQLALVAADAGIRQLGSMLPAVVLQCLPVVLQTAGDTAAASPVRVSAVACIASAVTTVGNKLVPLLPQTAAVVLSAAQAACEGLLSFDHALQQQGDAISSDDEQDDEDETLAARSQGEQAALQLVAALLALEAMVDALGPFMSSYLKKIVQLLVHKQVLSCSTAGAADVAARLRAALPAKIPIRLLLEPLVSQWEYAVAAGGGSSTDSEAGNTATPSAAPPAALLDLVASLSASMEPATAVTYHEAVVSLILKALDVRQKWLTASAGSSGQRVAAAATDDEAEAAAVISRFDHSAVHTVESAALKALSAIVMKLSESKFKPLFLRMVDWANAGGSSISAATADHQGRSATFMAVVCMLAQRLRGVFAPYFKYFAVLHMKLLAGDALASEGKRPKKKHRKAALEAASRPQFNAALSAWLARLRAVRAVHLLALHEAAATAPAAVQEQQERFDRLLPLVVEQLSEAPPADVADVLAAEGADVTLDLPGGPVAALGAAGTAAVEAGGSAVLLESCDLVGTAAVGALLQMAAAGGSDVIWKPLHHALLMASRGGSTRAKLLALGGVSRLADMLREEYLMLLPEALPFISELIEDGEVAVEGAAQGLIAQLESLSGEKLEQYLKT